MDPFWHHEHHHGKEMMSEDWTDWSWCECRISQNRFPTYISMPSLPVCLLSVNQTLMITWRENIKSAHHRHRRSDHNILIAWSKLLQEERTHTRTHAHTHTHTHTHTHRTTVDGHSHKRLERRSQEFANVLTQGQGDSITVSRDTHHSICSTRPAKTQHLETDWTHTHKPTEEPRGMYISDAAGFSATVLQHNHWKLAHSKEKLPKVTQLYKLHMCDHFYLGWAMLKLIHY